VFVRRLLLLALVLSLAGAGVRAGQRLAPTEDDRPIFRVSTSLVQLDAVVTDKKGRHITTLGPDDFEVYQNGRSQQVAAVAYVRADDGWVDTSGLPPLPPSALRPRDARRVVAFLVDDLRMSFSSMHYARRGLLEFVDEQWVNGDLAGLVTTSGGFVSRGGLTFHRQEIRADIGGLRYYLSGASAASVLDPDYGFDFFGGAEIAREYQFAYSAVLRIADVLETMKELPGRKSIVLISEGFTLFGPGSDNATILAMMQRVVDRANRAGVVFYAIDPRGLMTAGISAADASMSQARASALRLARRAALRNTQDSLRYVAGETGGFAVINSNDLARGVERIMTDQMGYYLIGYEPEDETLGPSSHRRFHKVKIKVKRKGLKVRTRSGFYGVATG
jgi:VWFA-related protein